MDLSEKWIRMKNCDPEMPYIFISYSNADSEVVYDDVLEFQRRGYNIWIDEKNLDKKQDSWKESALEAIKDFNCSLLVFYVSRHSLISENCLNELLMTSDPEARAYHFGDVDFICVDVEEIGHIEKAGKAIHDQIVKSKASKDEKKNQLKVLSRFLAEFFNSNERVRIHPRSEVNRKTDYYLDILSFFPEDALLDPDAAQAAAKSSDNQGKDSFFFDLFNDNYENKNEHQDTQDKQEETVQEETSAGGFHIIKGSAKEQVDAASKRDKGVKLYGEKAYDQAAPLLKEAALHDPMAAYYYGLCLYYGNGVPSADMPEAMKYFLASAEEEYLEGMYYVGTRYYYGSAKEDLPKDEKKAFDFFTRAAKRGHSRAIYYLGMCYYYEHGTKKDYAKAFDLFRQSAEKGYEYAMFMAGQCYEFGNGTTKDLKAAVDWYKKAAEKGHKTAKERLDQLLNTEGTAAAEIEKTIQKQESQNQISQSQESEGIKILKGTAKQQVKAASQRDEGVSLYVKKDYAKAAPLLKEAALYDPKAAYYYGLCLYYGNGVPEVDRSLAMKYFEAAAEKEYLEAMYYVGNCYYSGNTTVNVDKDEKKAFHYLSKASDRGHREAKYYLGLCYYYGRGTQKDETKAFNLFTEIAGDGHAKALYYLGMCYCYEHGTQKDEAKAFEMFRQSADKGYAAAIYQVGVCYYYGKGVEKDVAESTVWFLKSAESGDVDGQYWIGYCYYNGKNLPQDMKEAEKWLKKAAEGGSKKAKEMVEKYFS